MHEKEAWKTQGWRAREAEDGPDSVKASASAPLVPTGAARGRPGRTETAGRRAVRWVPANHATKKGATRNKSLCILSHDCGQKNPYDSSLWY